jgi:signal transduction histidine kinase
VSRIVRSLLWQIVALILAGLGLAHFLEGQLQPSLGAESARWAGVLLATISVSALFYRLIIIRIERLNSALRHVADGDFKGGLVSRSGDEIGELTRSVDGMITTLRDNYEELRTHDELRRRMVANVSHELRTPLTSIIGYLETSLGASDVGSDTRHHIEVCHREAKRLARLVQDLFQLSKLDTHQLDFHFETVSLVELVDQVGMAFEQRFADKDIQFETVFPDDPLEVTADGNRLSQVVTNLLGNASVFTPKGGKVVLRCELVGDRAWCHVSDTGIGIGERDLPHIFDSFFHLEKSGTRNLGGTGLGLAICKAIMATHGGDLSVESHMGEGSTFSFDLALALGLEAD